MNTEIQEPILEFKDIVFEKAAPSSKNSPLNLSVKSAELSVMVHQDHWDPSRVSELALGLSDPSSGTVLYMGRPWTSVPYRRQLNLRAGTRRFFGKGGFLNNLDLMENITLSEHHHSGRTPGPILDEALSLAQQFGIGEFLRQRPYECGLETVIRAQWCRLFIGKAAFMVLEDPVGDCDGDKIPLFIELLSERIKGGTGILWLTDKSRHFNAVREKLLKEIKTEIREV